MNTPTSATPTAGRGRASAMRTPTMTLGTVGRRTPGTGQRLQSAARTPHARAALLAIDTRRATMLTPGGGRQSRRKSGRYMRESPRDLLRNLSRRLAPVSQPIASSSSPAFSASGSSAGRSRRRRRASASDGDASRFSAGGAYNDDDADSDFSIPLDRPRLSLPIADDDNDDDLRPHRSMMLEDEDDDAMDDENDNDLTMRSIELARRMAASELRQQARRSSLGSLRMSDYIDGFIGSADGDEDDRDARLETAFFPDGVFDHLAAGGEGDGEDLTFERLDSDGGQEALAGRESVGFGVLDVPADGNETTFMLAPQDQLTETGAIGMAEANETADPTEPADDPSLSLGTVLGGQDAPSFLDGPDDGDVGVPFDYDGPDEGGGWMDEADVDGDDVGVDVALASAEMGLARPAPDTSDGHAAIKRTKRSRHGIAYPSLPVGVVKRVAQTFAQGSAAGRTQLSAETVAALSTASDWFFEQAAIDLERYAKHAGRKTIDESDVLLLMKRQRQISATTTPFSLAQRFMPRELLQELRMVPETPSKSRAKRPKPRPRRLAGRLAAPPPEDGT